MPVHPNGSRLEGVPPPPAAAWHPGHPRL